MNSRELKIKILERIFKGEAKPSDLQPKQYTFGVATEGSPRALFINGIPTHREQDWNEYFEHIAADQGRVTFNVNIV